MHVQVKHHLPAPGSPEQKEGGRVLAGNGGMRQSDPPKPKVKGEPLRKRDNKRVSLSEVVLLTRSYEREGSSEGRLKRGFIENYNTPGNFETFEPDIAAAASLLAGSPDQKLPVKLPC